MALELNGTTGVSLVQDGVVTAADLASGAITSAALPAGSVLQVVQDTHSTIASTTGTTFADSGLSATITPTSASSKILVLVTINGIYNTANASTGVQLRILRGATDINQFIYFTNWITSSVGLITSASGNYLDSPSTTSATTYKIQFSRRTGSGTVSIHTNGDTSSITLMEIAG